MPGKLSKERGRAHGTGSRSRKPRPTASRTATAPKAAQETEFGDGRGNTLF